MYSVLVLGLGRRILSSTVALKCKRAISARFLRASEPLRAFVLACRRRHAPT